MKKKEGCPPLFRHHSAVPLPGQERSLQPWTCPGVLCSIRDRLCSPVAPKGIYGLRKWMEMNNKM